MGLPVEEVQDVQKLLAEMVDMACTDVDNQASAPPSTQRALVGSERCMLSCEPVPRGSQSAINALVIMVALRWKTASAQCPAA